jgi:hypothetical protein
MPATLKYCVLLSDRTSGESVGVIEFDPSGMLISHVFENTVHVNALNPILRIMKEPLYVKHSILLNDKSTLSPEILEIEAGLFAEAINQLEEPVSVGKYTIKAKVVCARK